MLVQCLVERVSVRADLSLLSDMVWVWVQMSANKNRAFKLKLLLAIDSVFFLLELGVGAAVGSLALLADSFHSQSPALLSLGRSAFAALGYLECQGGAIFSDSC